MRFLRIFIFHLLGVASVGAEALQGLTDDQLLKGMNGSPVEGYSSQALELELKGSGAAAFVERCKAHEGLQKMMVDFPRLIEDQNLKEDVITFVLRSELIWDGAQGLDQVSIMKANILAFPALSKEFFLDQDPGSASLALCLLSVKGRDRISQLYSRLLRLERSERSPDNPKMDAITRSVQEAISTYGTDEYLRGSDAAEKNPRAGFAGQRQPHAERGMAKDLVPPSKITDPDPSLPWRHSKLFWIVISIVAVVAGLLVVRKRTLS